MNWRACSVAVDCVEKPGGKMPLQRLEHYLVLSDDIHATRDFYCDVLGMIEGFRPELDFPGFWLYLGDIPCIHIAEWRSYAVWTQKVGIPISARAASTGAVDHIAFNGTSFAEVRERLVERRLEFSENSLDDIGLKQLFLRDPNGVPLEINFRS
jgi:catechol 2,3-dioxygenase-like lactoylglutathione lyase family enzyme